MIVTVWGPGPIVIEDGENVNVDATCTDPMPEPYPLADAVIVAEPRLTTVAWG